MFRVTGKKNMKAGSKLVLKAEMGRKSSKEELKSEYYYKRLDLLVKAI